MSKHYERKGQYRPKEQERGRFGFEYIRDNINYRTEIPPIPEKPKHRPDEKIRDKKIEEIQTQITNAKEERKQKKEQIKNVNKSYDDRIEQIKRNVELGRRCIEVLYSDLDHANDEIDRLNSKIRRALNKISDNTADIKELKAQARPQKRTNKKLEDMTIRELDAEKESIEYQMSTRELTKKEELELNALLTKIGRIRADHSRKIVPEPELVDNSGQIAKIQEDSDKLRQEVERHKTEKNKWVSQREEADWKIHCIRDDIAQFFVDMKEIAALEQSNDESQSLYEESKVLKNKIYDLREQITQVEKEFTDKVNEYQYEQEKIRWIAWATKVQEQKREEWEAEKAERKRQKLREKEKGDKGELKTTEENKPEQKEERKRPNRNQREIDNCVFLIDYCKRLYPSASQTVQAQKKAVNLQEELKKGAWAKEKGVQIIQSKKAKRDEEEEPAKPQRKQIEPKEEEEPASNKFAHDYFVQKSFDNAKVIPPSAVEELDKIIKELEDKVEYYLSHPDEGVDSKFEQDRRFVDKNAKPEGKYTKSKGSSKVINTEDFPSLS